MIGRPSRQRGSSPISFLGEWVTRVREIKVGNAMPIARTLSIWRKKSTRTVSIITILSRTLRTSVTGGRPAIMSTESLTDEQLKEQAIKEVLVGDYAAARRTASQIGNKENLRQAWQKILFIAAGCRDVRAVIETIVSCPDEKLFHCHSYRDLPHTFIDAGDIDGAIEIARTMGDLGLLGLVGTALHLAKGGDLVKAKEVLSYVPQDISALLMPKLNEDYSKARAQQNRS